MRWLADSIDGLRPGPLDAVFAGGGGFTLPRWLLTERPGSRARVLEVDPDVTALARRRLGLRTSRALRVTTGDARVTLRRVPTSSADLVVGDAFGAEAVPWHLATAEWMRDVRRVLRPGGLYALNVIDRGPLSLFRAEAATLLREFRDVRAVALPGPAGPNLILLASDRPLPAHCGLDGPRGPRRSTAARCAGWPATRSRCATTTRPRTSCSAPLASLGRPCPSSYSPCSASPGCTRPTRRCCPTSRSPSTRGRRSACWAPTAPASRPCCGSWPESTPSSAGRPTSPRGPPSGCWSRSLSSTRPRTSAATWRTGSARCATCSTASTSWRPTTPMRPRTSSRRCRRRSMPPTPGTSTRWWTRPWTPCAARRATRRSSTSAEASAAAWPCAGCCSPSPTCCCSTSPPTTSTPSRSAGWSATCTSTRAPWWR